MPYINVHIGAGIFNEYFGEPQINTKGERVSEDYVPLDWGGFTVKFK